MSDEDVVAELSMSIEDTNALRTKLGLKPLAETPNKAKEEHDAWKKEKNLIEKEKKEEELREKIKTSKENREVYKRFQNVQSLGTVSDPSEYDAANWVKKLRMKDEKK